MVAREANRLVAQVPCIVCGAALFGRRTIVCGPVCWRAWRVVKKRLAAQARAEAVARRADGLRRWRAWRDRRRALEAADAWALRAALDRADTIVIGRRSPAAPVAGDVGRDVGRDAAPGGTKRTRMNRVTVDVRMLT
jgi:hypothetical protein